MPNGRFAPPNSSRKIRQKEKNLEKNRDNSRPTKPPAFGPSLQVRSSSGLGRFHRRGTPQKHRKLCMQRRIPDNKGDQFAIRVGTQKWLIGPGIEDVERFELSRDPREENGITSDAIIQTGADLLREYQQASQDIASSYGENAGASDLDAATRDRLRALGYIDVAESTPQP